MTLGVDARADVERMASALIDARDEGTDRIAHIGRLAGAIFLEAEVPEGAIVAARDGSIVTYDGVHPLLGHAQAGLHSVVWHAGRPRFSTCSNCGAGSGANLYGMPRSGHDDWELRCEACAGSRERPVVVRAAA